MNLYPIWNNSSHGPVCSASELAQFIREGQAPTDVIAFVDNDNLVARCRLLGWDEVAGDLCIGGIGGLAALEHRA